jgi:hypothetical protein
VGRISPTNRSIVRDSFAPMRSATGDLMFTLLMETLRLDNYYPIVVSGDRRSGDNLEGHRAIVVTFLHDILADAVLRGDALEDEDVAVAPLEVLLHVRLVRARWYFPRPKFSQEVRDGYRSRDR